MFIYSLVTSQHLLNKPLAKREIHKRVSVVSQLLFWLVEILLRGDTRLSPFPATQKTVHRKGKPDVVQPHITAYRSLAEDYPQQPQPVGIHKRVSVVSQLLFWLVEILLRMYIVYCQCIYTHIKRTHRSR